MTDIDSDGRVMTVDMQASTDAWMCPIILARRNVHNRFGSSWSTMRPLWGNPGIVPRTVGVSICSQLRCLVSAFTEASCVWGQPTHVCICHRDPASRRVCKAYAYYADPVQPPRHLIYLIVSRFDQMHEVFGCRGPFMANVWNWL